MGDIYGEGTCTEGKHTCRGNIHGGETYKEVEYTLERRLTWNGGLKGEKGYMKSRQTYI